MINRLNSFLLCTLLIVFTISFYATHQLNSLEDCKVPLTVLASCLKKHRNSKDKSNEEDKSCEDLIFQASKCENVANEYGWIFKPENLANAF